MRSAPEWILVNGPASENESKVLLTTGLRSQALLEVTSEQVVESGPSHDWLGLVVRVMRFIDHENGVNLSRHLAKVSTTSFTAGVLLRAVVVSVIRYCA